MNLGDGLLFELENGKPKLILLNRGEKVPKNSVKQRARLPSVLSCRQPSRLDTPRAEEQPIRKQNALNGRSHQNKPAGGGANVRGRGQTLTSSKTQEIKAIAKVKPAKPQNARPNRKPEGSNKKAEPKVNPSNQSSALSDSVSCVTNEKLQQILVAAHTNQERPGTEEVQADSTPRETQEAEVTRTEEQTVKAPDTEKQCAGLLSWVEQRPSEDRAMQEAKKAQWKKELDEQMALKHKLHRSAPAKVQGEEDIESLASVQSSISYKDLPAAIRSSLRVGESAPVDEAELTQEQKLEQRRRWLQELDKQREETSERRRLERLQQRQTEDQQLWASHFDSLQRPPLTAAPPSRAEGGEGGGVCSSLSQWEEPIVRASVDSNTSGGHSSRASHVRTMTSLLDPAELEERERRRLKQLQLQRAIELQVEERRQRKEEEEKRRKQEEEEEERRVQEERERLQRQYERDALRERHKEQSIPEVEPTVEENTEPPQPPCTITNEDESPEQEAEPTSSVHHHRDTAVQTEEVQISQWSKPESGEASAVVDRAQVLQMLQMLHRGCGAEVYEPFSRTERSRRDQKRPEWNTHRPSRRFVPASKRYPEELQRQRQESRLRRQAQLLALQRNPSNNPSNNHCINHKNNQTVIPDIDQRGADDHSGESQEMIVPTTERGRSPVLSESPAPDFLPYVRTDEVFQLNTHETQPAPALLQKTQRQQEIIRGLAQLREGLLQKQRELESDLSRSRLDNDLRAVSMTSRREL